MPWVLVPTKDVLGCVKPRGAAKKRYYSGISKWGNLIKSNLRSLVTEVCRKAKIGYVEGTQRTETT